MCPKPNSLQSYWRTPSGVRLSVYVWGGGPPQVLLLHGFGDNALVWDHFASTFDNSSCRLAVDLRGHGRSDWDPTGRYAHADFVADVVHVLEELCPEPVVLVGHSLGAQIAIDVAVVRRLRTRAVVLVDVALSPNELSVGYVRRRFRERPRVYDSAAQYVAMMREQLPLAQHELLEVLADGALCAYEDGHCEERSDPLLMNVDESIDTLAMLTALKQIARPILLVRGQGSAVLSRAAARQLLAELPQSRVTVVNTAGHAVMLDNPRGFCAAVRPYILKLSSGTVCDVAPG
jgi:pimeloyl-ACP methyl ester carboxylesterase